MKWFHLSTCAALLFCSALFSNAHGRYQGRQYLWRGTGGPTATSTPTPTPTDTPTPTPTQTPTSVIVTPGNCSDDSTIGSISWSNPSNAKVEDGTIAQASVLDTASSHYLKCTSFGLSIPAGSTINGVKVSPKVKIGIATGGETFKTASVRIFIAGSYQGTNKTGLTNYTSTLTFENYGGNVDLWGLDSSTMNPTNLNDSTFGASIQTQDNGENPPSTGRTQIDIIKMTVWYTPP